MLEVRSTFWSTATDISSLQGGTSKNHLGGHSIYSLSATKSQTTANVEEKAAELESQNRQDHWLTVLYKEKHTSTLW